VLQGLQAVRIFCADLAGNALTSVTSDLGVLPVRKGGGSRLGTKWGVNHTCPGSSRLVSASYLSHSFTPGTTTQDGSPCPIGANSIICRPSSTAASGDPAGGLNLDMRCSDGTELKGDGESASSDRIWGETASCPEGSAVCGIRSRLHQGFTDRTSNMGNTGLEFECCHLPGRSVGTRWTSDRLYTLRITTASPLVTFSSVNRLGDWQWVD